MSTPHHQRSNTSQLQSESSLMKSDETKQNQQERHQSSTTSTAPSSSPSTSSASFAAKLFKKCKSATFQIDGATYTIGMFISFIVNYPTIIV